MNRFFRRPHIEGQPDSADGQTSKFKPATPPVSRSGNGTATDGATGAAIMVPCPHCHTALYVRELEDNLHVCPKCGTHLRLGARTRIAATLDPDSFVEWDADVRSVDALQFAVGTHVYAEKLATAQAKTGEADALITGGGAIAGEACVVAVADFAFMGASMGSVYGEKLVRAAERAKRERLPLVTFNTSGGARMQEGLFSLMQMAKTTAAIVALGAAGLPHIAVLTDPCYGGVTASYATVADVILAEPGARIGFAGKDRIAQIMRTKLPEDSQTAEFQLVHGMVDAVVPRRELRQTLATLLALYRPPAPPPPTNAEHFDAERNPAHDTAPHAAPHETGRIPAPAHR